MGPFTAGGTVNEGENRKLVRHAYEAFGRGDLETLFEVLADDIVWTSRTLSASPLSGVYYGKSGVQQFFDNLDLIDLNRFDVRTILAEDDTVVALIDGRITVKATGKTANQPLVHVFTFKDGKVAAFDNYEDDARSPWQ
jgi:ketosteroid isomerase-like protein